MGSGSWSRDSFVSYTTSSKAGATVDSLGMVRGVSSTQDIYKQYTINKMLVPYKVIRECLDSDEHPETKPVLLALDVTGSMGDAATEASKQLNIIMEDLYKTLKDVEFCVMGIGDLVCDRYPIQISQFESDIRIADQMEKIYFEFGGGGNMYESYTAAWYMGARHTKLDCWKRGQKGILITIGDEYLNPYLPMEKLNTDTGDTVQGDVDTKDLYAEVSEKYDVYHIHVNHLKDYSPRYSYINVKPTFAKVIGDQNIMCCEDVKDLPKMITDLIISHYSGSGNNGVKVTDEGISW